MMLPRETAIWIAFWLLALIIAALLSPRPKP
jgi:hypothetical protein